MLGVSIWQLAFLGYMTVVHWYVKYNLTLRRKCSCKHVPKNDVNLQSQEWQLLSNFKFAIPCHPAITWHVRFLLGTMTSLPKEKTTVARKYCNIVSTTNSCQQCVPGVTFQHSQFLIPFSVLAWKVGDQPAPFSGCARKILTATNFCMAERKTDQPGWTPAASVRGTSSLQRIKSKAHTMSYNTRKLQIVTANQRLDHAPYKVPTIFTVLIWNSSVLWRCISRASWRTNFMFLRGSDCFAFPHNWNTRNPKHNCQTWIAKSARDRLVKKRWLSPATNSLQWLGLEKVDRDVLIPCLRNSGNCWSSC